jgi:hypothetical protein
MKPISIISAFSLCIFIIVMFLGNIAFSQVPQDRNALLNGEEIAQAKVAELHGYPSPKKVFEFARSLNLNDGQMRTIKQISDESIARAVDLGKQIIKIEEELNDALQTGFVNEKSVADDAQQIGRLRGRLRGVFLAAHLKAKKVLNANQLEIYKKLSTVETHK